MTSAITFWLHQRNCRRCRLADQQPGRMHFPDASFANGLLSRTVLMVNAICQGAA